MHHVASGASKPSRKAGYTLVASQIKSGQNIGYFSVERARNTHLTHSGELIK